MLFGSRSKEILRYLNFCVLQQSAPQAHVTGVSLERRVFSGRFVLPVTQDHVSTENKHNVATLRYRLSRDKVLLYNVTT